MNTLLEILILICTAGILYYLKNLLGVVNSKFSRATQDHSDNAKYAQCHYTEYYFNNIDFELKQAIHRDIKDFNSEFRHKYHISSNHPVFSEGEIAECFMKSKHLEMATIQIIERINKQIKLDVIKHHTKGGEMETFKIDVKEVEEAAARRESGDRMKKRLSLMVTTNLNVVTGKITLEEASDLYRDLNYGTFGNIIPYGEQSLQQRVKEWELSFLNQARDQWTELEKKQ